MDRTIKNLKKIGKNYFGESFSFIPKNNIFYSSSNNQSYAKDIHKNDRLTVKVINWFDDIWVYIEIKFVPNLKKRAFPNTSFSLSVFQGNIVDDEKTQLFRAEWDNYPDNNNFHAQPHWHIYPHKYKMKIYKDFEEYREHSKKDNDFLSSKEDLVEINRFHFAMNGQWSEKKSDIHTISEMNDLTSWFSGLLNHLKIELKYLKEE